MKKLTILMAVFTAHYYFAPGLIAQDTTSLPQETKDLVEKQTVKITKAQKNVGGGITFSEDTEAGGVAGGFGGGGGGIGGSGFGGGGIGGGDFEHFFGQAGVDSVNRADAIIKRLGVNAMSSAQTLVIGSSTLPAKTISTIKEDLTVMSRILDKATARTSSDQDTLTAMNVPLYVYNFTQNFRGIYLDGYGTLFLLNVRYPLVAPPKVDQEEKAKKPANSTWEQTKRELYGPRGGGRMKVFGLRNAGPREEYDEQKVEKLKESLLEALKNASNLQFLKPENFVTVVVTGGSRNSNKIFTKALAFSQKLDGQEEQDIQVFNDGDGGDTAVQGETVLTIRVKKSDVDEFAKGTLSFDDFQKHAAINAY